MECVVHIIVKAYQAVVAAAVAEVVEVNAVHIYIAVHVVVDNMTITVHVVVVLVHEQQRQEGILAKVHGLFITDMKTK